MKKLKIPLILLLVSIVGFVGVMHFSYGENTTIYVRNHRKEIKDKKLKLYVNDVLIHTLNIEEYYNLNAYVHKSDFNFGANSIELKLPAGPSLSRTR